MRTPTLTAILAATLFLAGCGGGAPPAAPPVDAAQLEDAVVEVGDLRLRASVVQTMTLSAQIADRYRISRSDDTVLLLVTVRRGPEATAVSVPATVTATATDLRGGTQSIAMREVRSGSGPDVLIDSIGIATVTAPETIRFEVNARLAEGGAPLSLAMTRDFYPR